ncbi:hypothetical protein HanRHA438_Chr17g0828761 [Helianthus annuus]|nr:hypothetical protein HanRHA438_Chr17g0828761 [Helianthus annuus]
MTIRFARYPPGTCHALPQESIKEASSSYFHYSILLDLWVWGSSPRPVRSHSPITPPLLRLTPCSVSSVGIWTPATTHSPTHTHLYIHTYIYTKGFIPHPLGPSPLCLSHVAVTWRIVSKETILPIPNGLILLPNTL